MKRVFSAIEISPAAKKAVADHIFELRREFPDSPAKWVYPDKMHLTLKFIGAATDGQIESLITAQSAVASSVDRLILELSGTGVFPDKRSAKVLWIGVAEGSGIRRVKSELDSNLEKAGIERDRRTYHPHLTVARLRTTKGCGELVSRHLEKDFGPVRFGVERIVLFESTLKPEGPAYSILHTANFSG